ncbi:hypothetical protein CCL17_03270 [Pseudomonas congelans]|nr:hypothetical protein CCL17_03270 [Pseudomonas congelans]
MFSGQNVRDLQWQNNVCFSDKLERFVSRFELLTPDTPAFTALEPGERMPTLRSSGFLRYSQKTLPFKKPWFRV